MVGNSSKTDIMCTANILDSIFVRLKKECPNMKEVVLVSDNAVNYSNLTFPLMAFYIAKSHGLFLAEIVHPDS